jgi:hypothetical protein
MLGGWYRSPVGGVNEADGMLADLATGSLARGAIAKSF